MSKYYLKERLMDGFMIVFDSILTQNKFGSFWGWELYQHNKKTLS